MGAVAEGRKLVEGLVTDGARLSARHWVLTEVPVAVAGTARGTPAQHGMWSGI